MGADQFLFTIAPYFGFVAALSVFAIVPFAAPIGDFTFQIIDVEPWLLYIFAITSLGVYGAVLAGANSNSKFALLGGLVFPLKCFPMMFSSASHSLASSWFMNQRKSA